MSLSTVPGGLISREGSFYMQSW